MPAPLLAVDAPSLLYRAFFALPQSIRGAGEQPVNALLGTANLVLWVVERHRPRAVVMCSGAESAAYRAAAWPGYHADRPAVPDELAGQWQDAPRSLGASGWPWRTPASPRATNRSATPPPPGAPPGAARCPSPANPAMFQGSAGPWPAL